MAEFTACARHPKVETGLRCAQCDTPICPSCSVNAVVGQRCPTCAKPAAGGGPRRRPEQIRKAAVMGLVGVVVGGGVLGVLEAYVGFLMLIASYFVGVTIGQRVREAASGNTVDIVRAIGIGSAVLAVLVAEVVIAPALRGQPLFVFARLQGIYPLLQVAGAAYGANRSLQ